MADENGYSDGECCTVRLDLLLWVTDSADCQYQNEGEEQLHTKSLTDFQAG